MPLTARFSDMRGSAPEPAVPGCRPTCDGDTIQPSPIDYPVAPEVMAMVDMAPHAGGARFVQADDVETMVFDWGTLHWL
ncbi:MAG: hypothetical protein EBQ56_00200, partial [Proteobacteria bacterium]|nr:hypothetical protein [Pseudomonadota bacterium]